MLSSSKYPMALLFRNFNEGEDIFPRTGLKINSRSIFYVKFSNKCLPFKYKEGQRSFIVYLRWQAGNRLTMVYGNFGVRCKL